MRNRIFMVALIVMSLAGYADADRLLSVGISAAAEKHDPTKKDVVAELLSAYVTDPLELSASLAQRFPNEPVVLSDLLQILDELGVPHKSESEIVYRSRLAVTRGLIEQDVNDPLQILEAVNFDEEGNAVGDYMLSEILAHMDVLGVEHESETEIIRSARRSVVAEFVDRGETDPVVLTDLLNQDEEGNEVGDYTRDEVEEHLWNLGVFTDAPAVDVGVETFPQLLSAGAAPPLLLRMIEANDHASFVAEDESGHVSVVILAGVRPADETDAVESRRFISAHKDQMIAVVARKTKPTDAYGRLVGVAFSPDGQSLNMGLIQNKLAVTNVTDADSEWLSVPVWRAASSDSDTSGLMKGDKKKSATKAASDKRRRGVFPWWLILGALL